MLRLGPKRTNDSNPASEGRGLHDTKPWQSMSRLLGSRGDASMGARKLLLPRPDESERFNFTPRCT